MAVQTIPNIITVKNRGQEPLSLAGLITIRSCSAPADESQGVEVGETKVYLGKLDLDKRSVAYAALRNSVKAKKIDVIKVDGEEVEGVDLGPADTKAGTIKKDKGLRKASDPEVKSNGKGGQANEIVAEKKKGKGKKKLAPAPEAKSDAPDELTQTPPPADTQPPAEQTPPPAAPVAPAAETPAAPVAPAAPEASAAPAAEAPVAPTPPPAAPAAPESNEAEATAGNVPAAETPTAPSAGDL